MNIQVSAVVGIAILISACGESVPESDRQMAQKQEQAAMEANAQSGFPGVTNFTEKKMVKMLYELRDQKISTYSYAVDMQGRLWHVCDSIGYGLPYGVQYSNPEKVVQDYTQSFGAIPQPEPNGLFMPASADGTWVMCAGENGKIDPVYIEPHVIVSPRKLNAAGSWQQK